MVQIPNKGKITNKSTLVHFFPALIGLVLLIPFYNLNFSTKLDIIQSNFESSLLPGLFHYSFPVFVTATSIQAIVYFILYFKTLHDHNKYINQYLSNRKNITLNWLRYFLVAMIIFWILMVIIYNLFSLDNEVMLLDKWLYVFSALAVLYIGVMGFKQATIYPEKENQA